MAAAASYARRKVAPRVCFVPAHPAGLLRSGSSPAGLRFRARSHAFPQSFSLSASLALLASAQCRVVETGLLGMTNASTVLGLSRPSPAGVLRTAWTALRAMHLETHARQSRRCTFQGHSA